MSDTIQVNREVGGNIIRQRNEVLGDGAVKNGAKLLVAENGVTVTEYGTEHGIRKSVIDFDLGASNDYSVTITNAATAGHAAVKLATFPKGRIRLFDVTGSIESTQVDVLTCAPAGSGDYSFGTTATADATLNGTEVDVAPKAALVDPFVAGAGYSAANSILAATAQLDGTGTAKPVYLNVIIDNGDLSDNSSAAIVGQLTVVWQYVSEN